LRGSRQEYTNLTLITKYYYNNILYRFSPTGLSKKKKRFYQVNVEIYFSKNHFFSQNRRFVENRRLKDASHVIFGTGILDQPTQQQGHRRHSRPASGPGTQHAVHERRTAATESGQHPVRWPEPGPILDGAQLHSPRIPGRTEEQKESEHDRMRTGAQLRTRGRDRWQTRLQN